MLCKVQNLDIEIQNKKLITDFSHDFSAGQIYFFFGQIGLGKSLLLETMAELRRANAGKVTWSVNKKISFLFQKDSLIPWLTVAENLYLLGGDRTQATEVVFRKLGMDKLLSKKANVLSGGEVQKVNFYRAILNQPNVIFADEPFNSLDIFEKKIMYQILLEYMKSTDAIVFWVSHDLIEINSLADEVLCFDKKLKKHTQTIERKNLNLEILSNFICDTSDKL